MSEQKQGPTIKVVFTISLVLLIGAAIFMAVNRQQQEPSVQLYDHNHIEQLTPGGTGDTDLAKSSKMTLNEVIRIARTWGPVHESWYGKTAPDFVLTDIEGKEHKLSDYRGKDVLIIFWATWCGPCLIEIPHLIALRNRIGQDKLAMLAISSEDPSLVKNFAAKKKLNYTVMVTTGAMSEPYSNVRTIPSSFFIDPEGKIKLATSGLLSLGEIKAILQAE